MPKSYRYITILLLAILTATPQSVPAATSIKREFRAAWIATAWCLDWPCNSSGTLQGTSSSIISKQKTSLVALLDSAQNNGMNAVFFQVRPMGDALYKSSTEPVSSYLTGTRGSALPWDPLTYAITEAHRRGLELHAWVNPFRWSSTASVSWSTDWDKSVYAKGWILETDAGKIFNPGISEVRDYIVGVCKEIISNYKVDGLVFDDYFYTNPTPENSTAGDYALWQSSGTKLSIANWRRNNINTFIKQVYDMVQETKPYIRFGVSPAGVAKGGAAAAGLTPYSGKASDWQYAQIYSDPLAWLKAGSIDYVSPQLYWSTTHSTNPFGPLTQWWSYAAKHFSRHHFASHSITSLKDANTETEWKEYAAQLQYSRNYTQNKAPGCVFYSCAYLAGPKKRGLGNYLKANKFQNWALPPEITWKTHESYGTVSNLAATISRVYWTGLSNAPVRYTVYAIPDDVTYENAFRSDGDGIDEKYLLGTTYLSSFTLPTDKRSGYGYAVCVLDGYGEEYAPQTLNVNGINSVGNSGFSFCANRNKLSFSQTARSVTVINAAGMTVASYENVDNILLDQPKGVYIVKAEALSGTKLTSKFILY